MALLAATWVLVCGVWVEAYGEGVGGGGSVWGWGVIWSTLQVEPGGDVEECGGEDSQV